MMRPMRPMRLMRRHAVPLLMLLAGCASQPEVDPPAVLEPIEARFELVQEWQVSAGEGTDRKRLRLVPAPDGEVVYVADREGWVQARRVRDGRRVWERELELPLSAGPELIDGRLYLGTSKGEIVVLSAADGALQWKAGVSSEVLAPPRSGNGIVAVATGDGRLAGLDAADGKRRWVYETSVPPLSLRGTSAPVVRDGVVVAGFANGRVAALNAANGKLLWENALAVPGGRSELERMVDLDADPLIIGGTVYAVTYQGRVAALRLEGGAIQWVRDLSAFLSPVAVDGQLYLTDAKSHVWGLHMGSGASLWKQDKLHQRGLTAPTPLQGLLAVADERGYVHLIDRGDGALVGRLHIDYDGIGVAPVVTGDRLLVLGRGGNLTALSVKPR